MQRQKTEEEIAQERADEEFARKLQQELDAQEAAPAPPTRVAPTPRTSSNNTNSVAGATSPPPSTSSGASSTVQVPCPNCAAMNHIPRNAPPQQQFRCGSCSLMLPPRRGPGMPTTVPNAANTFAPAPGMSHLTCQNCRCINQIPVGAATQFMCGHCYRLLSFNASPQQIASASTAAATAQLAPHAATGYPATMPPPVSDAAAAPPVVYEGRVAAKSIQVRCGQCQTVNNVKVVPGKPTVEFTCTSCQATNEVDL